MVRIKAKGILGILVAIAGFFIGKKKHENEPNPFGIPEWLIPAYNAFGSGEVMKAYEIGETLSGMDEAGKKRAAVEYLKKSAERRGMIVPDSFISAIVDIAVAYFRRLRGKEVQDARV
jgi:hypothetical protein